MIFQHRCRSFKCFSTLLCSCAVFLTYYAIIEPKLRHNAYEIALCRLDDLLKNSSEPICTQMLTSPQFVLCRESTYGKLSNKEITVISAGTGTLNFEFEHLLSAEFEDHVNFLIFGNDDFQHLNVTQVNTISWLKYVLWVPYLGRWILYNSFREFLLEAKTPKPTSTQYYKILKMGDLFKKLNPWLLARALQEEILGSFQQLFLQIQIESEDPAAVQQWMAIVRTLKKQGFHVFKIKESKTLNGKTTDCQLNYFTSWIREQKKYPAKSMINPLEYNTNLEERLQELLTIPTISCNRRITIPVSPIDNNNIYSSASVLQWPVCVENLQQPCFVYSAKFGGPETFEYAMANLGCTVFLFDPMLNITEETRGPESRIRAFSWALGTVNAKIVSGMDESDVKSMLTYVKVSEIAEKLNHQNKMIDILRLDLLGGEWDVLESLASSQLIENYHQIVVTVHIWHGEEVFSLIDRFMRLQKLLNAGFEVFYSQPLAHNDLKDQSCCFVVGWLKMT